MKRLIHIPNTTWFIIFIIYIVFGFLFLYLLRQTQDAMQQNKAFMHLIIKFDNPKL